MIKPSVKATDSIGAGIFFIIPAIAIGWGKKEIALILGWGIWAISFELEWGEKVKEGE